MGFGIVELERRAIEMTYEDTCEVIRTVEKEEGYITKKEEQTVYTAVPCALSAGNSPTRQTETVNNIEYDVKIFLAPELEIKSGDKIIVDRLGKRRMEYKNVGEPASYETHQEVMAKREAWA